MVGKNKKFFVSYYLIDELSEVEKELINIRGQEREELIKLRDKLGIPRLTK